MENDLVLVPGGYRHRALIHHVKPGCGVYVTEESITHHQNLLTGELFSLPKHTVASSDIPGLGQGWITYAAWMNNSGHPITSFRTTWVVPPPPTTSNGQTVFLFPGIDPANYNNAILQPVLQWGVSHIGGGPYWTVSSWYVDNVNGGAHYSDLIGVNTGDTLVGTISLTEISNGKFSYLCQFENISGTAISVQNIDELTWCNETLEAYHITTVADYPNTNMTTMNNISLVTGASNPTVNWQNFNKITDTGQQTMIANNSATNGQVDIYYRS